MALCARVMLAMGMLMRVSAGFERPAPYETVEWVVASSDVIVLGRVIGEVAHFDPGRNELLHVMTVRVDETLKGNVCGTIKVQTAGAYTGSTGLNVLLFLDRRGAKGSVASDTFAPILAESHPIRIGDTSIVGVGDSTVYGYCRQIRAGARDGRADIVAIQTFDELLRLVRAEAARPLKNHFGWLTLLISDRSESFAARDVKWPRLTVLVDERLEPLARRWIKSNDPHDRWNGAMVLRHFRSAENVAAMRGLLEDPFTSPFKIWPEPPSSSMTPGTAWFKWAHSPYPLRHQAWEALRDWGIKVEDATLSLPAYPTRRVPGAVVIGIAAAMALLLVAIWVRGWKAVAPGKRPREFAGFGGVCLILLLMVAAMWVRSVWWIDDLTFRSGKLRVEIALLPGGARVLSFEKWDEPFATSLMSVNRDAKTLADWRWIDPANPKPEGRRGRFGFWRDEEVLTDLNTGWRFRAWTVPYWAMMSLLALPLLWRVWRTVRYRALPPGHCRNCGYDMRATPQRCPECGVQPANQKG